ncbi:MAG: ATP-dependent 6-phosphofructokinase [Treponema sp.]|nr:6-phosphofructokinase [Spirochaetia bacterium]MDY2840926.1 ATP-dependent 6-phosphofructokinase [Treponema sp.]
MKGTSIKTVGILTSGGDAPGLNAAIRAMCIAGKNKYGMKFIGFRNGYRGLIDGDCFKMDELDIDALYNQGGTVLGTSRVKPFKNPVPDPKTGLLPVEGIKQTFKKYKLDALVCLGGNGTNTTASLLFEEGFNVIGMPKTIDKDIVGSDETFGFATAVDVATEGIEAIRTTARSHSRAMVVEIMGHKVGWLGLYSGVAANADVILLPEIPYDIKKIAKYLKQKKADGQNYFIIACSEGALNLEESKLSKKEFKKARAEMCQSVGYRVAKEIEAETGIETRTSVLGYTQRGGSPSASDILLATKLGVAAADFMANKNFGKLVAIQNGKIVGVPLESVAGKAKSIPADDTLLQTARDLGICFGD